MVLERVLVPVLYASPAPIVAALKAEPSPTITPVRDVPPFADKVLPTRVSPEPIPNAENPVPLAYTTPVMLVPKERDGFTVGLVTVPTMPLPLLKMNCCTVPVPAAVEPIT